MSVGAAGWLVLGIAGLAALAVAAVWLSRPPGQRGSGDLRLHRLAEGTYL